MQAAKLWKNILTEEYLKILYNTKIKLHPSIGMDKVSPENFEKQLDENIHIIIRKLQNDTYHFTRYRMILFSKGAKKEPRVVCVPTIRDKLTATLINELLVGVYGDKSKTLLPQVAINKIASNVSEYTHFIKLDIKQFYSSIPHEKMINVLKRKIRKKQILNTIYSALRTDVIEYPIKKREEKSGRNCGVPEGLSFSNALANIYMLDVDCKYEAMQEIVYVRYVDDILILTHQEDFQTIKESIKNDINKLGLAINSKEAEGLIEDGFEYLGYAINDSLISVKEANLLKIEQSIESLLREVKNDNNYAYIEWKLNIKITGFIIDGKKYGWLFFYSQINDESILFHLDSIVSKLLERYNLQDKIKVKRFVRTYYEIIKALHTTRYIANIDEFDIDKKRTILQEIYRMELAEKSEETIEKLFRRVMRREIRDIEKDIQSIS